MADRFKLWHAPQNTNETIQDWKAGICQTDSLCEHGEITDIMCCDKCVFGLCATQYVKSYSRLTSDQKIRRKTWVTVLLRLNHWNLLKRPTNSLLIPPKELAKP